MESFDVITAKLVLGYLKSEKCSSAYREFLNTSSNLRHLGHVGTKYLSTRYFGQTLQDILTEYFEIHANIQGRLEATNFYNENHWKVSLIEQLLYLLNKVSSSRASTPAVSLSIPQESGIDYNSPDHRDYTSPDHSDIEATPVHALPGNAESEESYEPSISPRRKTSKKHGKCSPSPNSSDNCKPQVFDTEALAQNLMENTEFQEKIAQTINKVVERQNKERDPEELDKAIKSVVEEAQADPLFEELLQEILDSSSNVIEAHKNTHLSNPTSSNVPIVDKKELANSVEGSKLNSSGADYSQPTVGSCSSSKVPEQIVTSTEQVMTYNDALDSYLISTSCNNIVRTQVQNPLYINTISGLLIPSITTTVNPAKQLMLINKPTPIISPTVLTEQDIMKMPIILKDNIIIAGENETNSQVKDPSNSSKLILPKPTIQVAPEVSSEIKDYFQNYTPVDEDRPSDKKNSGTSSTVRNKKTVGLKKVLYPKTRKTPRKKLALIARAKSDKPAEIKLPDISTPQQQDNNNAEARNSSEKIKTPLPSIEQTKKPTPKSASHVRNLNFSTPEKPNEPKIPTSPTDSNSTTKKNQVAKTLFEKTQSNKTWDADLRAIIPSEELAPKKQTKRVRKKETKSLANSTLEQEALLLENAIKTPIKPVDGIVEEERPNSQTKMILSPSKLNNTSKNILDTQDTSKFVTPDMPKQNAPQPMKANRNITVMLETPTKVPLPKTPGVATPSDIDVSTLSSATPFTKMLEANLDMKGVDIGSIQTPNLPITPGFASFTPSVDLMSPYSNRPTDYSTGSSYYQPSDNEQNKNLEAHLRAVEKSSAIVDTTADSLMITNRLQIFNKNVIGKKNLNLMRTSFERARSSDSSKDSSSSEEVSMEGTNDTVIFNKKPDSPKRTYALRTRIVSEKATCPKKVAKSPVKKKPKGKKPGLGNEQTEDIKNILMHSEPKTETSHLCSAPVTSSQISVLKEMEKKRQRTLVSLKSKTDPKTKKQPCGKFKIKPIAKVYASKFRKSESPKKRKKNRDIIDTVLKDLITSDDSDFDFSISENCEKEKLLILDKSDKTASDVEAQTLIEGLKERGIHLMHNKSPKKKDADKDTFIDGGNASQLESVDRETFDLKPSEDEVIVRVSHDEKQTRKKKKRKNSQDSQKVEYMGKLYLESIKQEVDILLKQTNFHLLLDLKSTKEGKINSKPELKSAEVKNTEKTRANNKDRAAELDGVKNKTVNDKTKEDRIAEDKNESVAESNEEIRTETSKSCADGGNGEASKKNEAIVAPTVSGSNKKDSSSSSVFHDHEEDLMDFALTGQEISPLRSLKKRRLSDENLSENPCKKMLKTLDVDSFLNKIHAGGRFGHKK